MSRNTKNLLRWLLGLLTLASAGGIFLTLPGWMLPWSSLDLAYRLFGSATTDLGWWQFTMFLFTIGCFVVTMLAISGIRRLAGSSN